MQELIHKGGSISACLSQATKRDLSADSKIDMSRIPLFQTERAAWKTGGRIRMLSISTMFPNSQMPVHAQFVKQRLDALSGFVDLIVVSPVPWFPAERLAPQYRARHFVPRLCNDNLYTTCFPRFISVPRIAKPLDGISVALAVRSWALKNLPQLDFDIIDCHLGYPDGFAGALLARAWNKPFVVTLRGHDINDLHRYPIRIRQVLFALRNCNRFFGVSQALIDGAVGLGAPADKGFLSANGVDTNRFFPTRREDARRRLGLEPECRYMLSVSHLVKRKGVDILLRALAILHERGNSNLRYIIVGAGGEEGNYFPALKRLADELGISHHIVWAGAMLNEDLHWYYSAADVFCLASEKEGWPNVILESMACATPVIAYSTWGVPEIVTSDDLGILVKQRTPEAFADAIACTFNKTWDMDKILQYAREHTWERTAEALYGHLQEVVNNRKAML
jgi:teichuronic acid biosynthesis glycosyltransferase TuaC